MDGRVANIVLHEARWIGEGSGDIILNREEYRFYLNKDGVLHVEDQFQHMQSHLKKIIKVFRDKDLELKKII